MRSCRNEVDCWTAHFCTDSDGDNRCTSFDDQCQPQEYTRTETLSLFCPHISDLRDLSDRELEALAADIKFELSNTRNCDFKPCGYMLDDADDIEVTDHNSMDILVQGGAVRGERGRGRQRGGRGEGRCTSDTSKSLVCVQSPSLAFTCCTKDLDLHNTSDSHTTTFHFALLVLHTTTDGATAAGLP